MRDLTKALEDISAIRRQLSAGTLFQGFGPGVIAGTGLLALAVAWLQSQNHAVPTPGVFVRDWTLTAAAATVMIGIEMLARSRRHHGGFGDAMLRRAVQAFLPSGFAGAALAAIVLLAAPDLAWALPGLWQMLIGIGVFAALGNLPRIVGLAGTWYLTVGAVCLWLAASDRVLEPWLMGVPFGIGQCLMAATLRLSQGANDDRV